MKTKIILASSSPRRIEMMHEHNMMFEIIPADVDETLPLQVSLEASVMFLALKKAMAVENMLCKKISDGEYDILCKNIITAADTLVCCDGILGKPADKTDAYNMLTKLRARKHIVSTGVAMICLAPQKNFSEKTNTNKKLVFCEKTNVFFKDYSDAEIDAYLDTPEAYDKAGSYAIQDTFSKYVDRIEGDFDNVIGFPFKRFSDNLSLF